MFTIFSIIIIILGLAGTAFYAGSESAFVVAGRNPIVYLSQERSKYKRVIWWLSFPSKMLSTTLVGTNISIIIATAFATNLFIKYFGQFGDFLSVVVVSITSLIFCEIIPKSIAYQNPHFLVEKSATPLHISLNIFKPIIAVVSFISEKIVDQIEELITPHSPLGWHEIETISRKGEVNLAGHKQEMLLNLFDFRKMTAFDLMDPIHEIEALDLDYSVEEALNWNVGIQFHAYPVSRGNPENIVGILQFSDILLEDPDTKLSKFVKPALYIPENVKLTSLYNEMKMKNQFVAIVVDEYGEISGVVYLSDLINNFIGKVTPEEKEKIEQLITTVSDGYIVDGLVEIEVINDLIDIELEFGRFKTIAGFLIEEKGGFSDWDEIITFEGWNFKIIDKDSKRIKKVKIYRNPEEPD